jgi:ABC-type branched-subunit amino acid transport system ATPase component/ABC-type branched-subunit amino acid transport system permease subunit
VTDTLEPTATTTSGGTRTRLSARPPAMRGQPYAWLVIFLLFIIAMRFGINWSGAELRLYDTFLIYTILVIGFYFVFGVSGQFAFSQAAFAMVGAYTSAWATRHGWDWILAVAFGAFVAGVIAFAFAFMARKANLFFLAIATLALSQLLVIVVQNWDKFTGQAGGEIGGVKPIDVFGWKATNETRLFWVELVALAFAFLIGIWMARSPAKREAIALRDQDTVAATLGVRTLRIRIVMFVLGSTIAAVAGSLHVHGLGFAQPEDMFGVELSLGIFVMLIVGGLESLWGAVLGAAFYVYLPYLLGQAHVDLFGKKVSQYQQIVYGFILLLVMVFFPEGLIGLFHRIRDRLRHRSAERNHRTWLSDFVGITRAPAEEVPIDEPTLARTTAEARARAAVNGASVEGDVLLRAAEIHVSFGGVHAVDGVSLDVRHNEILGLVGPNGSGKTTFLNALVGVVPASGYFAIDGHEVKMGVPGRSRALGVLRTYQSPQTYDHLSCIEDVLVSTADHKYSGILASWFLRPLVMRHERARWAMAIDALQRVGLARFAEEPAGRLTYGQRRLLELARAIAAEPTILLLDEPSAGLDAAETEALAGYIKGLRDEGISILVIDHKLDFITDLCDRVAVLELGHLVAVGDARTVFEDQRVVDAYLGVAEID